MLKKGQIVYIRGQRNVVTNMVEFKETTWIWQEYELVNKQTGEHSWLSVEPDENNKEEYYIYKPYRGISAKGKTEFTVDGKNYKLFETGTAYVKNFWGNTDVDMNEKCQFYDYICEADSSIISFENWSDESEVSIGYKIPNSDIKISEEFEVVRASKAGGGARVGVILAILLVVFPIGIIIMASIFGSGNQMSKYIEKSTSKYTYVTSITNNENNKKAKVYKSKLATIDATVKDIINGVPEGITKTTDIDESSDNDGIGLETKREYAYIYKEGNDIYVQVSEKKYVQSDGKMYHSSHTTYYTKTFRSTAKSSVYTSYAASARQSSISSRRSSGGGTSSGK